MTPTGCEIFALDLLLFRILNPPADNGTVGERCDRRRYFLAFLEREPVVSLYDVLSVPPTATRLQIETAYLDIRNRASTRGVHAWVQRFARCFYPYEFAYRVLISAQSRAEYDADPSGFHSARVPPFL
jgi:hypothetical protein